MTDFYSGKKDAVLEVKGKMLAEMNTLPDNAIIVREIANNTIKGIVQGRVPLVKLKLLGFSVTGKSISMTVSDECEKLKILNALIALDALFLFGYGWYPSEVMALYREQGFVTENYRIISWLDPVNYRIECR